jgi:hypothetical protein
MVSSATLAARTIGARQSVYGVSSRRLDRRGLATMRVPSRHVPHRPLFRPPRPDARRTITRTTTMQPRSQQIRPHPKLQLNHSHSHSHTHTHICSPVHRLLPSIPLRLLCTITTTSHLHIIPTSLCHLHLRAHPAQTQSWRASSNSSLKSTVPMWRGSRHNASPPCYAVPSGHLFMPLPYRNHKHLHPSPRHPAPSPSVFCYPSTAL